MDEILNCDHSIKATEKHFHLVLFSMLYNVVQTFECVDETPKCDHDQMGSLLSFGAVYYAVRGGSNF